MNFEWDEGKNRLNRGKHGFDFAQAEQMFRRPLIVHPDIRRDYGEERWVGIGTIQDRIAVVAFATRGEDTIRIVSLRKANHEEYKEYETALRNGLEED